MTIQIDDDQEMQINGVVWHTDQLNGSILRTYDIKYLNTSVLS